MRVLITNDDGHSSTGIRQLLAEFPGSDEVTLVAPMSEMSGVSSSLTIRTPLFVERYFIDKIPAFAVSGTPADCVKLALANLLEDKPDIVISGINQGPNTGINIFFSGTIGGALQAAIAGIPAMAVSLASYTSKDFKTAAEITRSFAMAFAACKIPERVFFNVNIPNLPRESIKGLRFTKQGPNIFKDRYQEHVDPRGRKFFFIDGIRNIQSEDPNIDDVCLNEGYISITPLIADLTAHSCVLEANVWRRLQDVLERQIANA